MEPRVAEINGARAPIVVWGNDSPSTPPPDYKSAHTSPVVLKNDSFSPPPDYFTARNSPVILHGSKDSLSTYPNSPKSISSNNNQINGDVIPYAEGVKFVDSEGNVFHVEKDDSICSSGSSGEDDDKVEKKSEVPDGGWGWVVVFVSLIISMIADGISFSFGLMYLEFLKAFEESSSKTAWIGSLFMAVPLLSGPIMSAFVDRYGCRSMTMLGGIISGFGFFLAMFGNSVEYEYMTFGVIAGLGLGLCYVTAVVSVCQWFEKYRGLATGLGACGTGLGTSVYAPMTQYFIEEFGWRGTVLLLGGTFLNMCVCGALQRDPEYMEEKKPAGSIGTKSIRNASSCGSVSGTDSQFPGSAEIRNMIKSGKKPEDILCTLVESFQTTNELVKEVKEAPRACHSLVDLPTHMRSAAPLENIIEEQPVMLTCRSASDQGNLNQNESPERPRGLSIRRQRNKAIAARPEDPEAPHMQPLLVSPLTPPQVNVNGIERPKQRMSIFKRQFSLKDPPQSYLKHVRVHRNSMMYRAATLTSGRYHLRASSCPNIYRNSMTTLAKEPNEKWYSEIQELCRTIFDFSMFLEFHFLLMSLATILLFTFFIVPYFYLVAMMTENGFTAEEGSVVIGNVGLINAFGMVFFGWVGDQPWVNVAKLFSSCMVLTGISCIFMPLVLGQYWLLNITVWAFGLFFASSYSLTPSIIVELIPIERFSTAYGLILLCQGIGNLVGPPIAGLIYDLRGIWNVAFYIAGGGIIVCGVLIGIIPFTKNRKIWGTGMLEMDRVSNA